MSGNLGINAGQSSVSTVGTTQRIVSSTNAAAVSSFNKTTSASNVSSSTSASTRITQNTTSPTINRTTTATSSFQDRIIIGTTTYISTPVTITDSNNVSRTILAYVRQ